MKKIFLTLSTVFILGSHVSSVGAAETKPSGTTISPALQEIVLEKDQPILNGSFTIANHGEKPETFEVSAIDMGTLDETGGLVFSGLSQDYQRKYGLAKWLLLEQSTLTVPPRNVSKVGFSIKNEASLSPGGHYGAIVVRPAEAQTDSKQRVALSPQAASLLFLRKVGGEKYKLSLPNIESNHSVWRLPTKVSLPFENNGNVHVVPRGVVRIRNSLGREIAKGIINPESALILPERSRTFTVTLDSPVRTVWPGRYSIEVDYRYDGQEKFTRVSQSFYTANLRILLLLLGLVILLSLVVYKSWKHKIWRRLPKIRVRKRR